jgi:hypothetical protein
MRKPAQSDGKRTQLNSDNFSFLGGTVMAGQSPEGSDCDENQEFELFWPFRVCSEGLTTGPEGGITQSLHRIGLNPYLD